MDGWWNEDGYPQEPWESSRQENPFARNSAAVPDQPAAQPEPEPTPQPGQLYGLNGAGAQSHSFSQIRQGDLYGYAAPEATPGPAFPDSLGEDAGLLPFGAFDPDPLTGEPPFTGGVPFFGNGSSSFTPGGDSGAFAAVPFQTSYTGFPPLTGNTSGRMQPVDPNMPWQAGNSTGTMQPVDPNMPWLAGNSTGTMQPVDPGMPWQAGNSTGTMQPVDPNMPWLAGNSTGTMQPVDPNMPWQAGNTSGRMQPVDPNMPWLAGNSTGTMQPVDPNMPTLRWDRDTDPAQWQPAGDPAFMDAETQRWQPGEQPWQPPAGTTAEDWILPAYPEADPNWKPAEGETVTTPDFLKDIVEPPKPEDPDDRLNIPVYLRKPKLERKRPTGKPIRKPEAAGPAATAPAADDTAPESAVAANEPAADAAAADAGGAAEAPAEAAGDIPGGADGDGNDTAPNKTAQRQPNRSHRSRRSQSAESGAADVTPDGDIYYTDAVYMRPSALKPLQPVRAESREEEGREDGKILREETRQEGTQQEEARQEGTRQGEGQPVEDRPEESLRQEAPAAEARQEETREEGTRQGEGQPVEDRPEENLRQEAPAAETRQEELRQEESRQGEGQPVEEHPEEILREEAPAAEAREEGTREEGTRQEETRQGEGQPVEDRPEESLREEAPAAETRQEESRQEESRQEGTREGEVAPAEPKPRRSRLQERQNAVLQPAPSLPRKRRSQPQAESTPEGTHAPFVKAAAAEDTGADAPSARPLTEAVSLIPGAVAQPSANPTDPGGNWPAIGDPELTDDDSYRFRQLFGQQPLCGDMQTVPQPLPGPAADDPNVPYADELLPPAPATDEAIEAAAMQDAALETALSGGLQPLAPGQLYGAMPTPPATETPVNPYAAAFGAAPLPPDAGHTDPGDDLLPGADWAGEDALWAEDIFAPVQPEESAAVAEAAPQTADRAIPQPVTDSPAPEGAMEQAGTPQPDASAGPLFPIDPAPFPELNTLLDEAPLQLPADEPAAAPFGTSSYDAGAMPNPSRGNLPYEVVSAFDTDSRKRAELLAAQYARQQAEPLPEPQPQPLTATPLPVETAKPPRAPIKPMRVVFLVVLVLMLVFCLVMGGRMLLGYVQNTEDWAEFYKSFSDENGVNVNQAGEMVQLRSDGSTFPPSGSHTPGPLVTPLPQTVVSGDAQSGPADQSTAGQGRTRQSIYYGNELRNILEPMASPHKSYPEVKGRLIIPGVVDEWVVQRNNTYYLNHNYRGSAEEGGAVFIDAACTLDTPPENLHLRASDSAEGQTFQPLWQYKTEGAAFALGASLAFVTTLYEQIEYQLVAVFEATLDPSHPMYFNYASSPTFASDTDMMNYITQVRQRSLYALPAQVQPGDRLLTLSTVSGVDTADEKSTSLVLIFAGRPRAQ